jgi:Zn-dependent peptidase ImmA (M78 family)
VDGFISGDLKTITVDEFVYESRLGRYRFTLAHELAHAVHHKRTYKNVEFSTIKEWMRFVKNLDVSEYGWLEYQAYAFGGLILVPPMPLKKKMEEAVRRSRSSGLSIRETGDVAKMYIVDWLAKQFAVSRQVIEKRIEKDRLWPQKEMG